MVYPKKAQIELTNRCNLDCSGCHRKNMTRKIGDMSWSGTVQVLKFLKEFGITEVHFHNWGEPLMAEGLATAIKNAKTFGFTVGFTTNGTLLTISKLIRFADFGLDILDISYHKRYHKHLMFMYKMAEFFGIKVSFRCVVFSQYQHAELQRILKGYNVKWQRGMILDKTNPREKICSAIRKILMIQVDGTIVPCCMCYDNQLVYGHIDTITPQQLRDEIDKLAKELPDYCKACIEVDNLNIPRKLT